MLQMVIAKGNCYKVICTVPKLNSIIISDYNNEYLLDVFHPFFGLIIERCDDYIKTNYSGEEIIFSLQD